MKSKKPNSFKNILIAQTAFLGDLVLTTPFFAAVAKLYPRARLTLLTTPLAAPLVEEDPNLDEIILYDKKNGESLLSVVRKVRAKDFDLYLAPHRSHRTSLIGFLSEIPVRVGYREAGFPCLYTRKVRRPMELHEVDRILALLEALDPGGDRGDKALHVGFTPREEEEVGKILSEAGVSTQRPLAGICPGSVWATKRWTPEGFAKVGRELEKRGFSVVLVGGPDDAPTAARVNELLGGTALNAAGRTSLKALAAWMARFDLFVTNDSAPLHVAAARNVPSVAVFGPTVKAHGFFPYHKKSRVVEIDISCRPCGSHGHDRCPKTHFKCMREVSPEAVLKAVDELLESRQ